MSICAEAAFAALQPLRRVARAAHASRDTTAGCSADERFLSAVSMPIWRCRREPQLPEAGVLPRGRRKR